MAAAAAAWVSPTTFGIAYRSGPLDTTAVIEPPSGTLVPATGSVSITVPGATVSENRSTKSIWRPSCWATVAASVCGSAVRAGVAVKRPSVRYQPARAAIAVSISTSSTISQPRRRRAPSRSRREASRSPEAYVGTGLWDDSPAV